MKYHGATDIIRDRARVLRGAAAIAGLLLVVAGTQGCSRAELRLADDPEIMKLRELGVPARPLRLGVAPIQIVAPAPEPAQSAAALFGPASDLRAAASGDGELRGDAGREDPDEEIDEDGGRATAELDAFALRAELCEALRSHGRFSEVRPIDPSGVDVDLVDEAFEGELDALLTLKVHSANLVFRGRNGLFIPNVMLWYYLWVPSWWMRDETYGVDLDAEMIFTDVRSEAVLAQRRLRLSTDLDLDDFERGWDVLGIFRVPGGIEPDGWRAVGETVLPYAFHELKKQAILEAARHAVPSLEGAGPATTFALVAGVGSYPQAAIRGTRASEQDIDAMDAALARSGVPAKNVRRLEAEQATRHRLEDELSALSRAADENDTIVLYFSGVGTIGAGGEPVLLGHDADPLAAGQTGLGLLRVRELIARGRAGRAVVIIDAGFGAPEGAARSFRDGRGVSADLVQACNEHLSELTEPRDGLAMSVILAGAPGQAAGDLAGAGMGLFTYTLVEGYQGKADADGDGAASFAELAAYAAREVAMQAGLDGRQQDVRVYGSLEPLADSKN